MLNLDKNWLQLLNLFCLKLPEVAVRIGCIMGNFSGGILTKFCCMFFYCYSSIKAAYFLAINHLFAITVITVHKLAQEEL